MGQSEDELPSSKELIVSNKIVVVTRNFIASFLIGAAGVRRKLYGVRDRIKKGGVLMPRLFYATEKAAPIVFFTDFPRSFFGFVLNFRFRQDIRISLGL